MSAAATPTLRNPRAWPWLAGAALLATAVLLGLRAIGAADHVTVLVGMPRSEASWVLGPAYVAASVLTPILAPALLLAALADAAWGWAGPRLRARRVRTVPIERSAP